MKASKRREIDGLNQRIVNLEENAQLDYQGNEQQIEQFESQVDALTQECNMLSTQNKQLT